MCKGTHCISMTWVSPTAREAKIICHKRKSIFNMLTKLNGTMNGIKQYSTANKVYNIKKKNVLNVND